MQVRYTCHMPFENSEQAQDAANRTLSVRLADEGTPIEKQIDLRDFVLRKMVKLVNGRKVPAHAKVGAARVIVSIVGEGDLGVDYERIAGDIRAAVEGTADWDVDADVEGELHGEPTGQAEGSDLV